MKNLLNQIKYKGLSKENVEKMTVFEKHLSQSFDHHLTSNLSNSFVQFLKTFFFCFGVFSLFLFSYKSVTGDYLNFGNPGNLFFNSIPVIVALLLSFKTVSKRKRNITEVNDDILNIYRKSLDEK